MLIHFVTFSSILVPLFAQEEGNSGCKNVSEVFQSSDGQSCQVVECFQQTVIICASEESEEEKEENEEKKRENEEKKKENEEKKRVIPSLPFELPEHAFVINPFEEEDENARIVGLVHFIHKVIKGIKRHPVIGTLGYIDWVLAWLLNTILEKSVEIIIEELLQIGHHRPNMYHTRPPPKKYQKRM